MSDSKTVEPTAKEGFFMMHVLKYSEGKPKVEWDKVAAAEGLKSGVVAAVRFRQIKKRLGWESDEAKSDEAKSDGASNSKGTSVLAAASPSKVTKATKGKAKALTPRSKKAIEALEQAVKAAANIDEDVEDSEDDGHALNTVIDELAAASDEMKSIEDSLFFE